LFTAESHIDLKPGQKRNSAIKPLTSQIASALRHKRVRMLLPDTPAVLHI
jgi:hypothetical protein